MQEALPLLERDGIDLNVYYIASTELFDMLPAKEQTRIFPHEHAEVAMGITGFTMATMYRWITSPMGRAAMVHPYRKGHYLGSGQADKVLQEAGLDGQSQYQAILKYVKQRNSANTEAMPV